MNIIRPPESGRQLLSIRPLTNKESIVTRFPNITHMLKTVFNVEDGLSEDVAIRIYRRSAESREDFAALKGELREAFSDPSVSWKILLSNEDYEVFDTDNEYDAREYAMRILWVPIFDSPLSCPNN